MNRLFLALVAVALTFAPSVALAAPAGDHIGAWSNLGLLLVVGIVLGTGIMPSAGALGNEYAAITRRAFIPRLIVNTGKATPVVGAMMANAQMASGGISSVTAPVQGAPLTTAQAVGFDGSFNAPGDLVGISDAEYNLKAVVVPIPFFGMEGLIQQDAAVIPKIAAKMNDAGNQIAQEISTRLFTNATNGTIYIDGFPLQTATTGTYGNIDRAANTWWQGFTRSAGSQNPTRALVLNAIVQCTRASGGEKPDMGVMGPGTWSLLAADFLPLEQYVLRPNGESFGDSGVSSAFTALMVANVPIFVDFDMTEGQLLLLNTRYTSFYIHESAAFAFTGFASTMPNMQLGYIGAVVLVMENVCVKPQSTALITGYNFNSM